MKNDQYVTETTVTTQTKGDRGTEPTVTVKITRYGSAEVTGPRDNFARLGKEQIDALLLALKANGVMTP